MNVFGLAGVLRARAELRTHDRWTREDLLGHQARALDDLRRFAVARSPLYRELHRGLEDAPLCALPIVTKADVMERFDDLVTDRDVRLADVERYLETGTATSEFRYRYRVSATGGTTGRRGIFLADPTEWRTVLASYARAYDWAGVAAGLTHRLRMAVVSSRNPSHQSSIVGATVASRLIPTLRLDATQPLDEIVEELNAFEPDAIVGYASMLRSLADEQLGDRLRVAPEGIISASEVLTDATRERLQAAFGVAPTNVYAATETAGLASECRYGRMHRYEDLVIAEIVDEVNRPVEDGEYGAKLLVTVLFSRTQPLIRYELSDRVAAAPGTCPDSLPFGLIAGIQGREEEVLALDGVSVHPNVFHAALEPLPVTGWQVIDGGGQLRVLLAQAGDTNPDAVRSSVRQALARVGVADTPITIELVDAIPRTALGKAPLIWRSRPGAVGADEDQVKSPTALEVAVR
jgi:putative adenylate-forming enzyme